MYGEIIVGRVCISSNIWLTSPVLMGNLISNMIDGLIKDMTAITDFFQEANMF